jgi:hypothetical protein
MITDRNTNIVRSARNKNTNCHFLPDIGICAPEPQPQDLLDGISTNSLGGILGFGGGSLRLL